MDSTVSLSLQRIIDGGINNELRALSNDAFKGHDIKYYYLKNSGSRVNWIRAFLGASALPSDVTKNLNSLRI